MTPPHEWWTKRDWVGKKNDDTTNTVQEAEEEKNAQHQTQNPEKIAAVPPHPKEKRKIRT